MPDDQIQAAASIGLIALCCLGFDFINDLAHQALADLAVLLSSEMGRLQQLWQLASQLAAIKGGVWQRAGNGAQGHCCVTELEIIGWQAAKPYAITNLGQLGKESL